MNRSRLAFVPLLALTACIDAPAPVAPGGGPEARFETSGAREQAGDLIPGRYIVVLKDVPDVSAVARALVAANDGTLGLVYRHALRGFSAALSAAAAARLAQHPLVAYVEQDRVMAVIETQTDATWGLDRIDQRDLPLNTTYVYNATGAGVDAYIIDTGMNLTHNEFTGRVGPGRDEVDNDSDPTDCNGHGTHVAGTVGGTTYGVAKAVRLIAVRVLNCNGSGTTSGVIAGVDWVTAQHVAGQPAVANMSLGGGFSQALNDAVTNSVNDGVVYAVAAGNGYSNACDGSPASTAAALTIGATNQSDAEAAFSDRGPCLDMWAPGVGITSAWIGSNSATNTISGTSMATPHVAGAAALYLETTPAATAAEVDDALSSNATTGKITWTDIFGAKPPPPPPGQDYLLYTGFISCVDCPPPPPPPAPPAAPSNLTATAVSASQIDLSWTDNATDEDGFKIERCQGSGCTNFVQIATVGANVTSYSNTGLNASTTYRYRVRAFNAGGNSGYSNEAEATTHDAPPPPPNTAPVARYTWSCAAKGGRVCNFNGSSSTDDGGVASYSWDFGDGSTGSGVQVSHTFAPKGTYNVTLTVTDNGTPPLSHSRTCAVQTGTSGSCQ